MALRGWAQPILNLKRTKTRPLQIYRVSVQLLQTHVASSWHGACIIPRDTDLRQNPALHLHRGATLARFSRSHSGVCHSLNQARVLTFALPRHRSLNLRHLTLHNCSRFFVNAKPTAKYYMSRTKEVPRSTKYVHGDSPFTTQLASRRCWVLCTQVC